MSQTGRMEIIWITCILKSFEKEVKRALKTDKMRFRHTIGVADTAACLASRYGIDMQKGLYKWITT